MKKKVLYSARLTAFFLSLILVILSFSGCEIPNFNFNEGTAPSVSLDSIPEFDGSTPYVVINDNVPFFDGEDTSKSYETYSKLDSLGRCGVAISCIGTDLMPTEERGSIGQVKPSGWQTIKYDIVDGKYLYNRCHLIGFQLTGENANRENLITGTRYMNVDGMLPFENMVADYLKSETDRHVLYRVTPIFDGENLVANGVLMEARSVEDNGKDLEFCVYVYNAQPGITINYKNGNSCISSNPPSATDDNQTNGAGADELEIHTYVLNTKSRKYHKPSCSGVATMSEENKSEFSGTEDEVVGLGYTPCGICKP